MASAAKITATLNLDTGEWTRALTRGKDQLRGLEMYVKSIKLKKLPMPELEGPKGGGLDRMQRQQGQWDKYRRSMLQDVGKSSSGASLGVLELSRAFEDAQYGMRGVLNNIPSIIQGFGGSAGLAGALSMAGVTAYLFRDQIVDAVESVQDAWNNLTGETQYQKMIAGNVSKDLAHAAMVERMRLEAEMQGEAEAALAEDVEAAADRRRAAEQKAMDQRIKGMELDAQIAEARRGGLPDQEKAVAALAAEKKLMAETLALQIRFYKERLANEAADLKAAERRLSVLKQEQREMRLKGDKLTGPEQIRARALPNEIAAAQTAVNAGRTRRESDTAALRDLEREQELMPKRFQVKEIEQQREKSRNDAERIRKLTGESFEMMGDVLTSLKEVMSAAKKAAEKSAADARKLRETREDAENEHLRARGRGAAADRRERKQTEERRTRQLMEENPNMSAEEAAQIARRESRDRSGRSGQRIGGDTRPSGLDAFDFKPRNLRPETPNLDEMRQRKNSALPKVADNTGKGDSIGDMVAALKSGLATVVSKLEELKNSNAAPVADKIKPANQ